MSTSRKQPIEQKTLLTTNAEMKIFAPGEGGAKYGSLSGYASTFANADRVGDVIQKGAFLDSIPNFLVDGFIAIGHDWDGLPVATVTQAFEDDKGLYCTAEFHSTKTAQDARTIATERLERGKSVGLSIGFRVLDYDYLYDEDNGTDDDDFLSFFMPKPMLIKQVELYEFSLVTVPCNPMATVTGAKGLPPAGIPYAEHSIAVRAAVKEFVERTRELTAMRRKEGRAISAVNMARLQAISDSLRSHAMDLDHLVGVTSPTEAVSDLTSNPSTSIIDMGRAGELGTTAQAGARDSAGKSASKVMVKESAPAPTPPEESPEANVTASAVNEIPVPVNQVEQPKEEHPVEKSTSPRNETETEQKIRTLQAEVAHLRQVADLTAEIDRLKATISTGGTIMDTPSASTPLTVPAVPAAAEGEWEIRGDMVVPMNGAGTSEAPMAHQGQIDGDHEGVLTIHHADDPDPDDQRGEERPTLTILTEAPKDDTTTKRASAEDVRKEMARMLENESRMYGVKI